MEKKIKVVFVINDFLIGGAQRQLARQLRYFDREKFSFTIITLFQFENKKTLYHLIPEDVIIYKMYIKGFFDLVNLVRFSKRLFAVRADIVVSSLFFSNTICRMLQPFFGFRSIAREHNTYTSKTKLMIFIDKLLSRTSYKIVAVSKTVADFTAKQENIDRDRFVVINNGIDLEEMGKKRQRYEANALQEITKRYRLPKGKKIVVNVGRLTTQKNHSLLIRSFAQFVGTHPKYILCILGEGDLYSRLQTEIHKLNAEQRIFLLGSVDEVERFYFAGEFLISTSRIEGLSNVYLEALACGMPLVATKTGGTNDLLFEGENGFFIWGSAEKDVTDALEKVINASKDEMRKKAIAVSKKFDVRETVRQYEKLFSICAES